MYAAAGGASLAGRKARQHGRQPAPPSPHAHSPPHPAPTGVRAYSCQHWESRLSSAPVRLLSTLASEPHSPCDLVECAAGRAAWQEAALLSVGEGGAAGGAARRCSVLGDHPGARRDQRSKWHRNNRVRDASYGSSSDSEGDADPTGEPWGVARLLYAGLGILALGLVVYFVGTGDKGFKTPALRLVGPSLIFTGLGCCLLRITFCIFAKPCCRRRKSYKENRRLDGCGEGEEMPLARGPRVGPAQCSPARRLDASSCDVSSLSSGEEDERLRRYRTATPAPPAAPAPSQSAPAHLQQSAVQQIVVQQKQEAQPTASTLAGPGPRRPPPRNVSFAGGPDGELVLSPAQLRS